MHYIVLEKARPHKYVRREGTKGSWTYFYKEPKGVWRPEDIKIAPKGKAFRIYRGDAATVDPKTGKLLVFRWKEGKTLYTSRPTSFSVSKKIAENFAHGIAEHYGENYVPVLVTALTKKLKVSGFWGLEREVYPLHGKSKVKSIEILPKPNGQEIETAPPGTERIDEYREQARARLIEWRLPGLSHGKYSDEQILWEGYQWRSWAHSKIHGKSGWDWAMWEEIQRFAKQKGFVYKDRLTKQDLLDNPVIPDTENILGKFSNIADDISTNWRNRANRNQMWNFIKSPEGQNWSITSKREIWGHVKAMKDEDIGKNYPGLIGLKNVNSWEEALNTEIDVYRGISLKEGEVEKPYSQYFISYTVVPAMADKFARGFYYSYDAGEGKGIVVKRRIKFGDILGFVNNDGENEVLVRPPKSGQHVILTGPDRITYE